MFESARAACGASAIDRCEMSKDHGPGVASDLLRGGLGGLGLGLLMYLRTGHHQQSSSCCTLHIVRNLYFQRGSLRLTGSLSVRAEGLLKV